MLRFAIALALIGCGRAGPAGGNGMDADTGGGHRDSATGGGDDGSSGTGDGNTGGGDGSVTGNDATGSHDATTGGGVITGGPCISGQPGATAYRVRWANGGGSAYPVYEVNGLPDHSRDHTGAYGYQIGFTAQFVDPFLGDGGVGLDDSDFIDLELTTVGIATISHATLAIYGRSYNTTASGSFNWQTFDGVGQTATNFVSNVAPYHWYAADMTTELSPGDNGVLIRIKAGPASDALVVNRIELCVQAN